MRAILILLLVSSAAYAAEQTISAQGLHASSFSDDGYLIRKFTAQSASGPFTAPIVETGKVEFFGKSTTAGVVAVVEWTQARYMRADEVIVGDGGIQFTTDDGVVSGRGFRCGLETGHLDLQCDVKFTSSAFRMTGDKARIDFETKGRKKNDVIRHIAVTDNIVVERAETVKAPFDRAESTFARFSAEENKVFLKSPIVTWRKGEKSVIDVASGFFEIDLNESQPNKAPEPTPTSVTSPAAQEPRQP